MKYIEFDERTKNAISALCDMALKAKGLEAQGLVNFINDSVKDDETKPAEPLVVVE